MDPLLALLMQYVVGPLLTVMVNGIATLLHACCGTSSTKSESTGSSTATSSGTPRPEATSMIPASGQTTVAKPGSGTNGESHIAVSTPTVNVTVDSKASNAVSVQTHPNGSVLIRTTPEDGSAAASPEANTVATPEADAGRAKQPKKKQHSSRNKNADSSKKSSQAPGKQNAKSGKSATGSQKTAQRTAPPVIRTTESDNVADVEKYREDHSKSKPKSGVESKALKTSESNRRRNVCDRGTIVGIRAVALGCVGLK